MASILTTMESAIKALIEGMTVGDGYNYNWGTVNEDDLALCTFPCAQVIIDEEENLDEPNGAAAGSYQNQVFLQIVCYNRMKAVNDNPNFAVNADHNKMLDDLKKLFGTYPHANTTVINDFMYLGMEREIHSAGDIFVPGRLITRWRARYVQVRTDPETVGC